MTPQGDSGAGSAVAGPAPFALRAGRPFKLWDFCTPGETSSRPPSVCAARRAARSSRPVERPRSVQKSQSSLMRPRRDAAPSAPPAGRKAPPAKVTRTCRWILLIQHSVIYCHLPRLQRSFRSNMEATGYYCGFWRPHDRRRGDSLRAWRPSSVTYPHFCTGAFRPSSVCS